MFSITPAQLVRHTAEPILLTVEEVADSLRLSRRTVESLISSKQLRSVTIGRSRRIHRDDLETFASYGTAEVIKAGLRAIANDKEDE
jgi:excisionase family DNA binding protein